MELLLNSLVAMLDRYQGLSMSYGAADELRVVGDVHGDPASGIWIECGRDDLFVAAQDVDWIDVTPSAIVANGRFECTQITWRPYVQRVSKGRAAAANCGGAAGRLSAEINGMLARASELGERVSLTLDAPTEGPLNLHWVEFDALNGELALMVGRIDKLRQVRLRADKLHLAVVQDHCIRAESFRGRYATLRPVPRVVHAQSARETGSR